MRRCAVHERVRERDVTVDRTQEVRLRLRLPAGCGAAARARACSCTRLLVRAAAVQSAVGARPRMAPKPPYCGIPGKVAYLRASSHVCVRACADGERASR